MGSINTLGSHSDYCYQETGVCVCVYCMRDRDGRSQSVPVARLRQARGYYWLAGLLWRPVVSERSNICVLFVCLDFKDSPFISLSLSLFFFSFLIHPSPVIIFINKNDDDSYVLLVLSPTKHR